MYQVDAFAEKVFQGNPAAVVPLQEWIPDATMQSIAAENNLSETAFFVRTGDRFHIRWFTPNQEVDLCGHATLATAFTIFTELNYAGDTITFDSKSGPLIVKKSGHGYTLDFPVWDFKKANIDDTLKNALKCDILEAYAGTYFVALLPDVETVHHLQPDFSIVKTIPGEGLVVTAKGYGETDFVSRFFMPNYGIDEDPVTGSAHCILAPIWQEKLGKTSFKAKQISARGGALSCEISGNRVLITGNARLYLKGEIYLD